MDKKELLGLRIKELRKEKKFTQEYLAEKLRIEPRQLSKLETGKHYPSFETIIALLETFNITFEELMQFEHLESDKNLKEKLTKTIQNLNSSKLKDVYKLIKAIV